MVAVSLRVSPRIAAIPRYEAGLTTAQVLSSYGLEAAVKLASNESPFPPLPEVGQVVASGIAALNRYPDPPARALRAALAERHGVGPEQVVIGNGSCELILLAGQALLDPGTTVIHAEPSFSLYPHLASASGAEDLVVPLAADGAHDLETMAATIDERTRLVVICNPNNPTGVFMTPERVASLLDAIPRDVAVLVDEAYFDFVARPDAGRTMSLARTAPNLLVTRTFSKAHGLCGLRVGYGVGSEDWIAALDRVRQPFNTNALAQAAALESLAHPVEFVKRTEAIVAERERVAHALAAMGVAAPPSQANFLLIDAEPDWHERLLRSGVIVRDGRALGAPGTLRVSIGLPEENDAFLDALAELIAG
jgi:histidinol-phosphate aminotransferase